MKILVLIFNIGLLTSSCANSKSNNDDIIVKGVIKNYTGQVMLIKISAKGEKPKQDTIYKTDVDNKGNFEFAIQKDTQAYYVFSWGSMIEKKANSPIKKNFFSLFIDAPNIIIMGDADNKELFVIKNSTLSNTVLEMENFVEKQRKSILDLENEKNNILWKNFNKDSLVLDSLLYPYTDKIKMLENQTKTKLLEYYHQSTQPFMEFAVLSNMCYVFETGIKEMDTIQTLEKKELQSLANQSLQKYPHNKFIVEIKSQIDGLK